MLRALVAHRADQSGMAFPFQRENRQEVGLVEIDMQLAVKSRSRAVHIGDIKHLLIGPARKAGADALSDERTGSVTPGEITDFEGFFRSARASDRGGDMVAVIAEPKKFGLPFDDDAQRFEPLDEQLFVLILRVSEGAIRREIGGKIFERDTRLLSALNPKVDGRNFMALRENLVGKVQLTV